jgi:hypothetical protein
MNTTDFIGQLILTVKHLVEHLSLDSRERSIFPRERRYDFLTTPTLYTPQIFLKLKQTSHLTI